MRLLNLVKHAFFAKHRGCPDNDVTIVGSGGEELLLEGVPCHDRDLLIMPLKTINLRLCFPYVEHLDFLIFTSCQEPVSVHWVPSNLVNYVVMSRNCVDALATGSRVPHLDLIIFTTRQNE